MKSSQYVQEVFNGRLPVRPLFGEILIADRFIQELLERDKLGFKERLQVMELLNQDLVVVPLGISDEGKNEAEQLREITIWANHGSYFLMCLVNGPLERLTKIHGWNETFYFTVDEPKMFVSELKAHAQDIILLVQRAIKHGCQGVILAEDLAFEVGTFFPKAMMQSVICPILKDLVTKLRSLSLPVFLHSDGELKSIWHDLIQCTFTGFHGQMPTQEGFAKFLQWGGLDNVMSSSQINQIRGYAVIGTSSGLYYGLSPIKVIKAIQVIKGGYRHER